MYVCILCAWLVCMLFDTVCMRDCQSRILSYKLQRLEKVRCHTCKAVTHSNTQGVSKTYLIHFCVNLRDAMRTQCVHMHTYVYICIHVWIRQIGIYIGGDTPTLTLHHAYTYIRNMHTCIHDTWLVKRHDCGN